MILASDALPFDKEIPIDAKPSRSIIGPRSNVSLDWIVPVTELEADNLRSGTKKLFVWGRANYTDAAGKERFFVFRMTNGNAALMMQAGDTITLQPHSAGYDAN